MITLSEISKEEFNEGFPNYYFDNSPFPFRIFIIYKEKEAVGILILEERDADFVEMSLTIFEEYQNKILFKKNLLNIINFPFKIGYKKAITWTKLKSWSKLLERFKEYGVRKIEKPSFFDEDCDKIWFQKEIDIENV